MKKSLIDLAMGLGQADVVIKRGKIVNVITREVYRADIAVKDGFIAVVGDIEPSMIGPDTKLIDASNHYLAPGFIDAHIHFESSMLSLTEFCKATVKHGTTAIASDLMEVTIVAGMEGVDHVIREAAGLPLKLFQTVPAFMTEEDDLQTIGSALNTDMIGIMLKRDMAVGLAEVLYPPVLDKSDSLAGVLSLADELGKTAEGHAPGLRANKLNAYVGSGIRSDHESTSREEALEKLRLGLRVLMRQGSAATDLAACLEIITKDKVDSRYCSMVSDDIDALHIYEKGHLDHKVRLAVEAGVDPITALQMVTINPAESLKIDKMVGSISPGKAADIVFLRNLETCLVDTVMADGQVIVEQDEIVYDFPTYVYPDKMMHTIHLAKPIRGDDLRLWAHGESPTKKAVVIGANGRSLLTDKMEMDLPLVNGYVNAAVEKDVLHIACIERYGKTGGIGKGFIKGFGLKTCSIATSVGHDHHNITAIGSDADDMATAVNTIAEMGGGLVAVKDGQILGCIPLQLFGLLSVNDAQAVAKTLDIMQKHLAQDGCQMDSPYMTLAFITLIYIPELAITDKGLVEVIPFQLIPPIIDEKEKTK